jgi:hypothetical protein
MDNAATRQVTGGDPVGILQDEIKQISKHI